MHTQPNGWGLHFSLQYTNWPNASRIFLHITSFISLYEDRRNPTRLVAIEIDSTISIPQTKAEAFMHPTLLRVITHAKAFIVLQIELLPTIPLH